MTTQQSLLLVGLCRSEKKICTVCKEPILKKEAVMKFGKKGKKQCHYCCSLDLDKGVGEILNQKDLREIFMDFYRFHKSKISKTTR